MLFCTKYKTNKIYISTDKIDTVLKTNYWMLALTIASKFEISSFAEFISLCLLKIILETYLTLISLILDGWN